MWNMAISPHLLKSMLFGIAEFFRFISNNETLRLYYVVPINKLKPFAYQHSPLRDVATCVNILDLVALFTKYTITLRVETKELFKQVIARTLTDVHTLYEKPQLPRFHNGSIGDIGFFLTLLKSCHEVFPDILPSRWQNTRDRLIKCLLERARSDGSIEVFFDAALKGFEKQSEAFYLPEALLGLLAWRTAQPEAIDAVVKNAVAYSADALRVRRNLSSEAATFYANWQFQLLYHWLEHENDKTAIDHLEYLVKAIMSSSIAKAAFGASIATVEVACYLEGLVHAECSLKRLGIAYDANWFNKEISRAALFLNNVQTKHTATIHGGFVHSLHSPEARLDVAGHVFSALRLYTQTTL